MSTDTKMFRGWPAEALEFYEGLEADNSKAYWTAHKDVYKTVVLSPMKAIPADWPPSSETARYSVPIGTPLQYRQVPVQDAHRSHHR